MTSRHTLRGLLAALGLSASSLTLLHGAALAQSGAALNYEDADLRAVVDDISRRTGRAFIIDPTLAGKVNIISPPDADLGPDEVWEVFLAALQLNGYTAVPIGDREYKIVRSQQALREAGQNGSQAAPGGSAVTRLVELRFVDVREAANAVRSLVADTGLVTPITETNTLIVADTAANVQRVVSLLEELDVDNTVVRPVTLQNAPASEVASTLLEIINNQVTEGRRAGAVSVVAADATNQVILRGNPQEVRRLIPIIEELDNAGASRVGLDAIYLNHADAEKVVELLQGVLGARVTGEGAPQQGGAGQGPSIGFDAATNAVVVNAPPDTQRLVRSIVNRLDIRRPQVLLEAIVVEISNTTARELGVQYLSGGDGFPVTAASFTNTQPNLVSAAGAAYFLGPGRDSISGTRTVTTDSGAVIVDDADPQLTQVAGQLVEAAVGQLLNYNGFLGGYAAQTDDGSVYGVLLSAIQSDSQSNLLSTPSVVVMDNEAARLQVGQEIPIVTGSTAGDDFENVFNQIERQDVGNILEVTPQINEGNTVKLEIKLEVSSIGAFTAQTDNIITNKSVIQTTAVAEDGQTLVLGGLIDNDRRRTESKVPILGDIPLLGNLFKGQNRQQEDTTLMVFIRPTILRDPLTANAATARKYDYARQQQLRREKRGAVAPIDRVLNEYLGTGGYVSPERVDESLPVDEPLSGGPIEGMPAIDE
ncbi:type II secretion system secretin GspD [Parvularcula oceani]|uniref:type II secretion system secretin GspD n=1 Tax=Parvularcula oceani TaxID=1247963 RepID=UPI00056B7418|nr:type II secretion system secretin GspD [Parvularcula oceani]